MKELADGLSEALDGASDVLVVYSDLKGVPVFFGDRETTLRAHFMAIMEAAGERTVLFPAFNYGWCEVGYYDPMDTPSQVGALSEYARERGGTRLAAPPFNFVLTNVRGFVPTTSPDVLGAGSVFDWLVNHEATVLAYGCKLRSASALHYTERMKRVPYRWMKAFPGKIEGHGRWTGYYYARPQGEPTVEYDWDVVGRIIRPAFTRHAVGPGTVHVGRADAIHGLLSDALDEDEHAFLTGVPEAVYERYGKPIRMEVAA